MESEIKLKVTGDGGEAIISLDAQSDLSAKKRPQSLLGRFRDRNPPTLLKGHSIEISASPRNSLTVALAMVAYPFKKNLDGTVEQFIHTPTTPNSDPRLQKTSAYSCSLKTSNMDDDDASQSIKVEKDHDDSPGKAKSIEIQSLKQKNLKHALAPEKALRPGSKMRRRNVQELMRLNTNMSNFSMNSVRSIRSTAMLSASSSKISVAGPLHPLDKQSLKNFRR